jgi:DNA-binding transcriptional regulator YiaG
MGPREIKALRAKLGLTQKQLAKVLGCKLNTVQQWEQDCRRPGEIFGERLDRLAKKANKLAAKLDTGRAEE